MGRELHRVPLDFDWPLNKPWKGFLNPHYKKCPENGKTCFNGETAGAQWLSAICRLIAMVGSEAMAAPHAEQLKERGRNYPHPYLVEWTTAPRTDIPGEVHQDLRDRFPDDSRARMQGLYDYMHRHPPQLLPLTPDLVELVNNLAAFSGKGARELDAMGLGNIDYDITLAILKAAKLDRKTWGRCLICKGDGLDPTIKEVYEAWKKEPPPKGPGWQLWETVSEGSPISPVFPTREEFVAYLVKEGYSQKAAEKFAKVGWVPSAVGVAGGPLKENIHSLDLDP